MAVNEKRMQQRLENLLIPLLFLVSTTASAQSGAEQAAETDPRSEGAVALVPHAHSDAEHAPGTEPHYKGVEAYEASRYWKARGHFLTSARFADKMSQFYLGAIYFNGDGVEADHARGWAWFELSAERGYPQMVEIADRIWDQLSSEQRDRGRRILEEELLPEFGDEVAVPRTARRMKEDRRRMTGSRLGTLPGLMDIYEGPVDLDTASGGRGAGTGSAGPSRSRYDFYAREKWDFDQILEREAWIFRGMPEGEVTLGEFEVLEPDEPDDPDQPD